MSITNATRLSDFAAGIGTEGAILKIDNANQRVGIGTQLPNQMLTVAGIVSATQYIGDGSQLEGITSAGLGTAIDETEGSAGAVVYYTDDLLTVAETTTINPPASASAAYTQYRDVKLNDSVDLIIETGDDFIPDILGLGTAINDVTAAGNGVFDEVYSDVIKNKDGLGAPTFANGFTSVGIGTFSSDVIISGNVSVGGTLTYEDVKNVDSVGLITARTGIKVQSGGIDVTAGEITASGDGINASSNLILKTGGTEQFRIKSNGRVGVGTDDPQAELVVGNHNSGDTYIQVCNSTTGFDANSGFIIGLKADEGATLYQLENNYMRFGTNQQERLRIGAAGQFGIGGANYGTAGQVITSQGASAAPQWATPSAGAWSKLTSGTFSSADGTLKEITSTHLTSAHIMYKLYMEFTMSATNFELGLNVKANGVWEESNYDYNIVGSRDGSAYDSSRSSQTRIHFGEDNHYSSFYAVEGFFANVHSTTERKIFKLSGVCNNSLSGYNGKSTWSQMGGYNSNDAVTGIRLKATKQVSGSGTFDHGWYLLEGYAP